MEQKKHTIDATDKTLGRLAVQIAVLLRGKDRPDFAPNKEANSIVIIQNIDKMSFSEKKLDQKKYYRHSGYLGGIKEISLRNLLEKNPEEVLKKAVFGMLPKNKLRSLVIKRLKIEK